MHVPRKRGLRQLNEDEELAPRKARDGSYPKNSDDADPRGTFTIRDAIAPLPRGKAVPITTDLLFCRKVGLAG